MASGSHALYLTQIHTLFVCLLSETQQRYIFMLRNAVRIYAHACEIKW